MFFEHLLSSCCSVWIGDTALNKLDRSPAFMAFIYLEGEETDNKHVNKSTSINKKGINARNKAGCVYLL